MFLESESVIHSLCLFNLYFSEILSLSQCIINATDNFRFCKMEQKYKDLQAQYIFNFVFNTSGIDVNGVTELCK